MVNKRRKSWREKLADDKEFPQVSKISPNNRPRWGTGTFVIAAPREVDELMSRVPKGRLTTIDELRKALAKRHQATIACPITTGIFAWIAAHAADEAEAEGARKTTPYWRTLKTKGELNPKYPGGIAGLKRKLIAEGHRIEKRGSKFYVRDFREKLAKL